MFPQNNDRTVPEHILKYAKSQIQEVFSDVSGVNFMMLCTTDGFELHTLYKKDHYNQGKLAAVSSSLQAMVTALMQELHLQGCQSITLDAENGKAIVTAVPYPSHPMIILTLAEKDVLLGQVLYMLKTASNAIQDFS